MSNCISVTINSAVINVNGRCEQEPVGGKGELLLMIKHNSLTIKGKIMAVSMTSTQFVEGVLQAVDSKGRPAQVQPGSVVFESSDEDVFTVEQDASDPLKIKLIAVGEGTAQLDYSADADLGDGVTTIEGFTAVEILPAMAVGFGLTFSAPQEQDGGGSTTTTSTTTIF